MENKKTNGNLALNGREYRVIKIEASEERNAQKLRVAAYCRVSSSSEDQLNSFMAQNVHYTQYISAHENWRLVDIYADEGITGTSIEKREDFKRMLADSQCGLIDRILVKSISRFARNTAECLEAIRQLKVNGTTVYFEKEYIETALYLISTPNTGLFFVYCSICCGFSGYSETVYCVLSLICRLNLQ